MDEKQCNSCACCGHAASKEDNGCCHGEKEGNKIIKILRLAFGGALLVSGIIVDRFFDVSAYVSIAIYAVGYLILGYDVIFRAAKNIGRGRVFDENFLMAIATVGAFIISEYAEAAAVMLFYQVGEMFQEAAVERSRNAISKLMDMRPDFAVILQDKEEIKVSPESVLEGSVIVVRAGEKIPLDGVVVEGEASLDTAALTGEAMPRTVSPGDSVLSGSVNQNGRLLIKTTRVFGESTVSKILQVVENASDKKAKTENFITKFARYYTPTVVGLAVLLAVIPPLFGGGWSEWVRRALTFLVISCPCAIVISVPLGFFGGLGAAARRGILIKGGNFLECLNDVKIAVFDKTGTLTKGVFKVSKIAPSNGFGEEKLLEIAAYAEAFSNHPIAVSILREYKNGIDKTRLAGYSEIAGKGVRVSLDGKTVLAGSKKLMVENGVTVQEEETQTVGAGVYVAADGVFAGCITVSDEIKPDGAETVAALRKRGVSRIIMLTGDNAATAKAVAASLDIEEVYSGLLPHEKADRVESLKKELSKASGQAGRGRAGTLIFTGDGINDAPSLAFADVGVAMGGLGSDAAIEAADAVLMTDEPSRLAAAIDIARFTRCVVIQNIVFALVVKAVFLAIGAFGLIPMWAAVFADVGVALLAVLNSLRALWKRL